MVAPVLPYLTDSVDHLDALLGQIAAAGATGVTVFGLHLRSSTRGWFMEWLARSHPELVDTYRRLYRHGAYLPADYRETLRRRAAQLVDKHRLGGDRRPLVRGRAGTRRGARGTTDVVLTSAALDLIERHAAVGGEFAGEAEDPFADDVAAPSRCFRRPASRSAGTGTARRSEEPVPFVDHTGGAGDRQGGVDIELGGLGVEQPDQGARRSAAASRWRRPGHVVDELLLDDAAHECPARRDPASAGRRPVRSPRPVAT